MSTLIVVLVAVVATLFGVGLKVTEAKADEPPEPVQPKNKQSSRDDVKAALEKLAETPAPAELSPGAMCYEAAAAPQRVEYVCPICGHKTIYDHQLTELIEWQLPGMRRQIDLIEGLDVRLDESGLCDKCNGDATPALMLEIRYAGEDKPHRVELNGPSDLQLLVEFTTGSLVHKGEADWETPLRDHLERLQELLGTKLD